MISQNNYWEKISEGLKNFKIIWLKFKIFNYNFLEKSLNRLLAELNLKN